MKTTNSDRPSLRSFGPASGWRVASDEVNNPACALNSRHASRVTFHVSAFTLIELLTVIAIIGALAALVLAVTPGVKKKLYIYQARAEMERIATAIDRYKAAYGFYPPDNHINQTNRFLIHQLYYELTGTKNISSNSPSATPEYQSLNDPSIPNLSSAQVTDAFGVGGFMNCTKPEGGEEAGTARNFLPDLKAKQVWNKFTNNNAPVTLLITAVGGPDVTYKPLNQENLNPWRYNSSNPTNNPGSYDLWIQLSIGAATNTTTHTYGPLYLICNWSKQVQVNSPMP
jgi:prepilin-type N-terminal cleavage/methylation domain-containing protein